ncbi:LLM class flavin-dependent oxidoreductase [Paenibacillus cremeus]|uniref:LLM class flavin-dependent oxidoreductase n=2 Tax=Paenibacillus cremeus TaxID=2163881 RepID=A0A559KEE3_9BACL|nr:LLM class flavin-dependent oxidoreductase [Paenibacillus cremeus]
MKLSVMDLVPVFPGTEPAQALEQALLLAQTAERCGYGRYWVAEHHDMPGLACTSPEVLLAYIGARTSRIRLGSGAVLLPHYKPLKVAESFHLLSSLMPGRIDLGIGRAPGGSAHVTMALSDNFLDNIRRLPEALQALMALLTGQYRVEGEPVTARPVPPQPPEVWMLGTNQKSAAYAAELGCGYVFGQFMSDRDAAEVMQLYREQFRPSQLTPEPRVMVAIGVVCADTEEEAQRLAAEGAALFGQRGRAASQSQSEAEREKSAAPERLIVGTAQQVKSRLEALQARFGVDEFLIVTHVPNYAQRLRSYELLLT